MPELETPVAPIDATTPQEIPFDPLNPSHWQEVLRKPETDGYIFRTINEQRERIEAPGGWKILKEKAYDEAEKLPDNILMQLFTRITPFIDNMPAGHSKAHVMRDVINLSLLYSDPEIQRKYDRVELMVGTLAGIFHDIGNAVQERYDDTKRFAGHAETGAYLFGKIAEDLLEDAPNMLKLIQYSIAAHTHYDHDITIKKTIDGTEITEVRKSYTPYDTVEGKDKQGIWLTRKADRLDLLFPLILRHALTKTVPTADYSGEGEFHEANIDEIQGFKLQFSTKNRTENERKKTHTKAEQTPSVIEHVNILFKSFFDKKNIYTKYDTSYFTNKLIKPTEKDLKMFTDAVTGKWVSPLTEQAQKGAFEDFYIMCHVFEPGKDINLAIDQFRQKFPQLTAEERLRWANGLRLLTTKLWQNWYNRTKEALKKTPRVSNNANSPEQKLAISVHEQAQRFLENFNPLLLHKIKEEQSLRREVSTSPETEEE
jgi:hypothetical protein